MRHIILLIAILLAGCSKVVEPNEASLNGDIAGALYDNVFSFSPLPTFGPRRITLSSGSIARTTEADANGSYRFANVSAGTYTITFEQDSFTSARIEGMQFAGNGTLYVPPISLGLLEGRIPVVDSLKYGPMADGYHGFKIYLPNGASVAIDQDSSLLANWAGSAQAYFESFSNINTDTDNVPAISNYLLRQSLGQLHPGDSFYVTFGNAGAVYNNAPNGKTQNGRFEFMPFRKHCPIIKLRYTGER